MASSEPGRMTRNCVSCGRTISWEANVCPYCGHDYRVQMMGPMAVKKESSMPVIGGVLILVSGLLEIAAGGIMVGGGSLFFGMGGGFFAACGGIMLVLGVVAILGGIFAIQRKHFGLTILGGILSLGGFFILGLIGLILVAVSREEFRD